MLLFSKTQLSNLSVPFEHKQVTWVVVQLTKLQENFRHNSATYLPSAYLPSVLRITSQIKQPAVSCICFFHL